MLNGLLGTHGNAGAAFDAPFDCHRHRLFILQFIDVPGAVIDTLAVPFAFVVIDLDGNAITRPFLDCHIQSLSCCVISLIFSPKSIS